MLIIKMTVEGIPERDQVSPFSSVIRLTWRRLLRWSADVCIELCNNFIPRFCKVPPQPCDGSTVIHDICSSSSSSYISLYKVTNRDVCDGIIQSGFIFSTRKGNSVLRVTLTRWQLYVTLSQVQD